MSGSEAAEPSQVLRLAAEIVAAHVSRNATEPTELPSIIKAVHEALVQVARPKDVQSGREPAVPLKRSVFNDRIICLECGKPFRTMKRHLQIDHDLTTDEYRKRYGLPRDYPLVAPEYAEARSRIALNLGLGRKKGAKVRKRT